MGKPVAADALPTLAAHLVAAVAARLHSAAVPELKPLASGRVRSTDGRGTAKLGNVEFGANCDTERVAPRLLQRLQNLGVVGGGPANPQSNTAGRHLLPTGRSFSPNGTGSCEGSYAEQVSLGVLSRVSRPSDAAAPCRLARHVAAGRRLQRRRSRSILGDILEPAGTRRCRRRLCRVRHKPGAPTSSSHCGLPRRRVGR